MTAPAFTPEEFDAAIQELVAAGKIPTVRKLREKLRGSNDTIIQRLDNWRATQPVKAAPKSPPATVVAKGNELFALVWAAAQLQAAEELDAVRQQMEARHNSLEEELADTRRDYAEQESTTNQLRSSQALEFAAREAECRQRISAELRAEQLEQEVRRLRAKVETLERESAPSAITPARLEELLRLLQQQAIVAKPPQKTRRVADVDANGSRPVPRRKRS